MDLMLGVATFGEKQTARQKDFVRARSAQNRTKTAALAFQAFFAESLILVQYHRFTIMTGHYFYGDERRNTKNDFSVQNHTAKTNKEINLT